MHVHRTDCCSASIHEAVEAHRCWHAGGVNRCAWPVCLQGPKLRAAPHMCAFCRTSVGSVRSGVVYAAAAETSTACSPLTGANAEPHSNIHLSCLSCLACPSTFSPCVPGRHQRPGAAQQRRRDAPPGPDRQTSRRHAAAPQTDRGHAGGGRSGRTAVRAPGSRVVSRPISRTQDVACGWVRSRDDDELLGSAQPGAGMSSCRVGEVVVQGHSRVTQARYHACLDCAVTTPSLPHTPSS